MSRLSRILNSVGFRRVLVIFVVGLVSRSVVNYVYDINVFKDYSSVISLTYYGFMAGFAGFISDLPKISFNVFDFKLVKSAIKTVCANYYLSGDKDKILVDNNMEKIDNTLRDKDSLVVLKDGVQPDKVTAGRTKKFKSAGVRGLYGDPDNRDVVYDNSNNEHNQNNPLSFRNRFKCRLLWTVSTQFSGDFVSYTEYSQSFHPNSKISIRDELKKGFSKR